MPRLLADNDLLLKAAHWGLLDLIPQSLGVSWSSVSVLESLIHRTRRRDRKLFLDESVAVALEQRLEQTTPMPSPDAEIIARLQGVEGLDAGEITLIAALLGTKDALLLTGDKRALRALAAPELADIAARLRGRVVCLEHLIDYALDQVGATRLSELVFPFRELDAGVRAIVPAPAHANEGSIRDGLRSYLGELDRLTAGVVGTNSPLKKPPN